MSDRLREIAERCRESLNEIAYFDRCDETERTAIEAALCEAVADEREACERIVAEIMEKAQDDSALLGPAVTGWAGREILRRLRERAK